MSDIIDQQTKRKLNDLRPKCSAVYQALYYSTNPLTTAEIHNATGVSQRTIRDALSDLQEAGLVKRYPNIHDGRKPKYVTTD